MIRDKVIPLAWLLTAMLIIGGAFGAGLARADGLNDVEWAYAYTYGKDVICATLDEYPTESGVTGIGWLILDDGFTQESGARIVNYSVETWCPQHWPLLQRIGRRARHEMPA